MGCGCYCEKKGEKIKGRRKNRKMNIDRDCGLCVDRKRRMICRKTQEEEGMEMREREDCMGGL